jgi:hypothetical protein
MHNSKTLKELVRNTNKRHHEDKHPTILDLEVPETTYQDTVSKEPDAVREVIKHPRRNTGWIMLQLLQIIQQAENLEEMEHLQGVWAK